MNPGSLRSSLLGIKTQAVEQAQEPPNIETVSDDTWEYLNQAIHDGDLLLSNSVGPVKRRALIVGDYVFVTTDGTYHWVQGYSPI